METVTVSIYGENYTVKAGDDPAYIEEVARYVDAKMREIASSGKIVTTSKIAILAALNIADDLFRSRQDWNRREEGRERKIEGLIHALQSALEK